MRERERKKHYLAIKWKSIRQWKQHQPGQQQRQWQWQRQRQTASKVDKLQPRNKWSAVRKIISTIKDFPVPLPLPHPRCCHGCLGCCCCDNLHAPIAAPPRPLPETSFKLKIFRRQTHRYVRTHTLAHTQTHIVRWGILLCGCCRCRSSFPSSPPACRCTLCTCHLWKFVYFRNAPFANVAKVNIGALYARLKHEPMSLMLAALPVSAPSLPTVACPLYIFMVLTAAHNSCSFVAISICCLCLYPPPVLKLIKAYLALSRWPSVSIVLHIDQKFHINYNSNLQTEKKTSKQALAFFVKWHKLCRVRGPKARLVYHNFYPHFINCQLIIVCLNCLLLWPSY